MSSQEGKDGEAEVVVGAAVEGVAVPAETTAPGVRALDATAVDADVAQAL